MKRYLIVEDDEMTRLMLQDVLSEFAPCDIADNGMEALILFENALIGGNPYSLLCVDLIMPAMNGLAFIRRVKEIEKTHISDGKLCSKIFVITSSDSAWDKADLLLENLCDDYIVKPFDRSSLIANLYKNDLVNNYLV